MTDERIMTITEGLKKLKLLDKRMTKNCKEIEKYSSLMSNEKPIFDTEAKQREEVQKLIQANTDLANEYCQIKAQVDYSNLMISVTIGDDTRTIHGWLTVLRKTAAIMTQTYKSLSTKAATKTRSSWGSSLSKEATAPTTIRLYDENEKRAGERKWDDLTDGIIEGRLEVINATTELLALP